MLLQVVAPKKKALEAALLVLDDQMAKLRQKQAELKEVTDKLEALNDDLENKQMEKEVKLLVSLLSDMSVLYLDFLTAIYTCG